MAFGIRWRVHGEAVPSRHDGRCLPMTDEWEDGIDNDGGEIEDYTRIPYPEAWNHDPDDSGTATGTAGPADDDDGEFGRELTHAANAWFRAVELLVNQGFPPDECEAEVMRRCAQVSRKNRALMRQIDQEETVYEKLDADESLCNFPWGRLCPEHGNTLREGRRGTYCTHEGCERRWPIGHTHGHCDLPAVVVTPSMFAKRRDWRLCAGHRRIYHPGPVLRTLTPTPAPDQPNGSTVTELPHDNT